MPLEPLSILGFYRVIRAPIMENQMEKKMENEMKLVFIGM